MSMDLRITTYRPYDDLVIGLHGELDLATTHKVTGFNRGNPRRAVRPHHDRLRGPQLL